MLVRTHRILAALALLLISSVSVATPHTITVGGGSNTFSPSTLTINVGDTVTFTNAGGGHNVVADGLFRCARGCDGDGSGGNGDASTVLWSDTITFNTPGTVSFYCEIH